MKDKLDEHRALLIESRKQLIEKWLTEHLTPALTHLDGGTIERIEFDIRATFDDGGVAQIFIGFNPGEPADPEPKTTWWK